MVRHHPGAMSENYQRCSNYEIGYTSLLTESHNKHNATNRKILKQESVLSMQLKGDYVLITRFATGVYDVFLTCPAKSMH